MNRDITIRGVGEISVKPDLIILSLKLETKRLDFEETMAEAAKAIDKMHSALASIGFEKSVLKTRHFSVNAKYESVKDKGGNYKRVFDGYLCSHDLNLEFDLDIKRLSEVLSSIGKCGVSPEVSISFSVKDKNAVNEALLYCATENARKKAETLTTASGVTLGKLLSIDYSWGELRLMSNTRYNNDFLMVEEKSVSFDIEPDDIDVSEAVTFVWEIC